MGSIEPPNFEAGYGSEVMRKQYFHLYQTSLSRQLGNDDANDDENDIDNFFWINVEHMKYHKENNLYTMSQSNFQITVPRQFSAAILLLFISAAVGNSAQGDYLEHDNNFLKIKKHISLVFQFEKNMLRNGLSTFKFLNSQKARLSVLFRKQVTLFWQKISH